MLCVRTLCCSDLHRGPAGHPATDATPGWAEAWASVDYPTWQEFCPGRHDRFKIRLGDMDELIQFGPEDIGELAGTDVYGNHDKDGTCRRGELRFGNTIFLHGHQFDPWIVRWFGQSVARVAGWLECIWPDIDVKAGRYGDRERYIEKAAAYAKKRGATQAVFGHLHQRFEEDRDGVHVVCTGCCCNGHMDFVEVEVLV